jgi:hypothetical protein
MPKPCYALEYFAFQSLLMYWTLDKIDVGQGATNGSSLTTPGLVYLG